MAQLRPLFVATLTAVSLVASATPALAEERLFTESSADGVTLIWGGGEYLPAAGWSVQRRAAGAGEDAWEEIGDTHRAMTSDEVETLLDGDVGALGAFWNVWESIPPAGELIDDATWDLVYGEPDNWAGTLMFMVLSEPDLAKPLGLYFQDTDATVGQRYDYRVMRLVPQPLSAAPVLEELARKLDLLHSGQVELPAPQGLVAALNTGKDLHTYSVDLSWEPEPGLFGSDSDVVGFDVLRATGDIAGPYEVVSDEPVRIGAQFDENQELIPGSETAGHRDPGVVAGTTYHYAVAAVTLLGGRGPQSNIVTINVEDTVPPQPLVGFEATLVGETAQLSWLRGVDPDLLGYELRLRTDPGGPATLLAGTEILLPDVLTYDHGPIEEGNVIFDIVAVDTNGNRSESTPVHVNRADETPPEPPADVAAQAFADRYVVSWTNPPDADLQYVYIFESLLPPGHPSYDPRPVGRVDQEDAPAQAYTRDLLPGQMSVLWVMTRAEDAAGNKSALTTPIELRIPDEVPPPAPIVEGTAGDNSVVLTWVPAGTPDQAGFNVYRGPKGQTPAELLTPQPLGIEKRSFTVAPVPPGVAIRYAVVSVDFSGNRSDIDDQKAWVELTAFDETGPAAPENVVASRNADGHAVLSWDKPAAEDLANFTVYRGFSALGPFRPIVTQHLESAFTDKEPTPPGVNVPRTFYRVSATDVRGNEGPASAVVSPDEAPPVHEAELGSDRCLGEALDALPRRLSGSALFQLRCEDLSGCGADEVAIAGDQHELGPDARLTIRGVPCDDGSLPRFPHPVRIVSSHVTIEGVRAPSISVGVGKRFSDVVIEGNVVGEPECKDPAIGIWNAENVTIANNATRECPIGISVNFSADTRVFNNTVAAKVSAIAIEGMNGPVMVKNNILLPTQDAIGLRVSDRPPAHLSSDRNIYWSGGRRTIAWMGSGPMDLGGLRGAFGQAQLSVAVEDIGTVIESLDPAHPLYLELVQGAGNPAVRSAEPTPLVVKDLRGRLRHPTKPDIGAVEREEN